MAPQVCALAAQNVSDMREWRSYSISLLQTPTTRRELSSSLASALGVHACSLHHLLLPACRLVFFPRVRTPCGHGAQVIIEGREKTD